MVSDLISIEKRLVVVWEMLVDNEDNKYLTSLTKEIWDIYSDLKNIRKEIES